MLPGRVAILIMSGVPRILRMAASYVVGKFWTHFPGRVRFQKISGEGSVYAYGPLVVWIEKALAVLAAARLPRHSAALLSPLPNRG